MNSGKLGETNGMIPFHTDACCFFPESQDNKVNERSAYPEEIQTYNLDRYNQRLCASPGK
jgi:hypothetical protein